MTLQGAVTFVSLFGPPIFGFHVFRRHMGRSLIRAFIDSLYIFAVCMFVLMGLLVLYAAGLFGESVLFALPFMVVVCRWVLMAPHFKHPSPANRDERDESPDRRNLS
jgi:fatty acid desaturase